MKRLVTVTAIAWLSVTCLNAALCTTAPLTTYINSGNLFTCTENSGNLTVAFNNNLLPSYAGVNLLSLNNSAAAPSSITVVPGASSLDFQSSAFTEGTTLLSSQAEVVQFMVTAATGSLASTNFQLDNDRTSAGGLGLGTGLAIGQELVCLGGSFTSLPAGLVTSVANGVLGTGTFGCSGTVLVGTAASSSGPLNAITSVLGLPNLTGVTDQASINLSSFHPATIDVIKLQALLSVTGGSAATDGFGDSFTTASTPEPNPGILLAVSLGLLLVGTGRRKRSSQS